ncbi:hypothetical protein [Actinoplanes teichomyceticus]|uniref:Lipoprotein n=1 Tax=Actinoplanes teichomyceticus TaxID=1867 RepID=A0A561WPY5_ACTTI|nr:hypothetical protein [Actinoplanes teichomyceticus]TWG25903.1 hypothetical protein FHX34_101877 [Actinoplanes teichomyceticus]GIF10978.1 hypothetical protein Ate01nite_10100 [Actinoplanes teichomyceticus]
MHRVRLGRLLLAGLLMIGGCGGSAGGDQPRAGAPPGGWRTAGCQFSRAPEYTMMGGIRMPVTPAPLRAAMERIERGGRMRFPESFAGIEVDQLRVRAIVYRVPATSAEFDDFIRQAAENTCIHVRDAAHAAAELGAWHDRVVTDLAFWAARGVHIVTVGSRHDGAGVEIGTRDVERARSELPVHYGPEAPLIFIEHGPITPLAGGGPAVPEPGD